MTLIEHLVQAGVRTGSKIGFIVQSGNDTDGWVPFYARMGMVCVDVPDGARDQDEIQDFDPKYDLLILWRAGSNKHLYILRMTTDAELYRLDQGGLMIKKDDSKILIGQSDFFMQSVCDVMMSLAK